MKKGILLSIALIFLTLAGGSARAQIKEEEKKQPTTKTIDVWRDAMPQNEVPGVVTAAETDEPEVLESSRQIEKRITDLEMKLAESIKTNDSVMLKQLLADGFVPVGGTITEKQANKTAFIKMALKNPEFKTRTVEKITVRVFGSDTAIATVEYKNEPQSATDGGFVATDVWVRSGNMWQAASHHISRMPKQP